MQTQARAELCNRMQIRIIIRCAPVKSNGILRRVWNICRQLPCYVRGHRNEIEVAAGRLAVRCVHCGWKSPGWMLADRRPSPDRTRPADGFDVIQLGSR